MSSASYDFAAFLVYATVITGVLFFLEWFVKRIYKKKVHSTWQFVASFFPVFVLVLILRSFMVEPFRIPTGSMKPTLLDGDFILVNKYAYGLRWPISNEIFFKTGEPKRGDVVVFRYPKNPKIPFIKRVVGLPGDTIQYTDKTLYINGNAILKHYISEDIDREQGNWLPVSRYSLDLTSQLSHDIFLQPVEGRSQAQITVPANSYFVMGDNRDNSEDSRAWGFVHEAELMGRATFVWFSWDAMAHDVRWPRLGMRVKNGE